MRGDTLFFYLFSAQAQMRNHHVSTIKLHEMGADWNQTMRLTKALFTSIKNLNFLKILSPSSSFFWMWWIVTSKNSHSKITRIKNYFQNIFQKTIK